MPAAVGHRQHSSVQFLLFGEHWYLGASRPLLHTAFVKVKYGERGALTQHAVWHLPFYNAGCVQKQPLLEYAGATTLAAPLEKMKENIKCRFHTPITSCHKRAPISQLHFFLRKKLSPASQVTQQMRLNLPIAAMSLPGYKPQQESSYGHLTHCGFLAQASFFTPDNFAYRDKSAHPSFSLGEKKLGTTVKLRSNFTVQRHEHRTMATIRV